jgi:hypothetical protein
MRLVLDTNMFRSLTDDQLASLASRGFELSISEIAIGETWARSAREYKEGKARTAARGLPFGRAKKLKAFVDEEYPIALTGADALERIRQQVDGVVAEESESGQRASAFKNTWPILTGIGYTDEEWVADGERLSLWLDKLDTDLVHLAKKDEDLWTEARGRGVGEESIEAMKKTWAGYSEERQLKELRAHFRDTWGWEPALAERLDAHICTHAWRLHVAAYAREMPKRNDGADFRLTVHLGEGFILLTGDEALVRTVDECGKVQAPWVRRLEDLEGLLPEGPPWGESARAMIGKFQRQRRGT